MRTEELLEEQLARAGAAVAVGGAAVPAGRAQALQHRARGAGQVARRPRSCCRPSRRSCSRPTRSCRRRRRCSPSRTATSRSRTARSSGARVARGEGRAARALLEVQVRVPGQHVARAAHAAELAADPVQAAVATTRSGNLTDQQVEFARTIHQRGHRPARADQRHPRPLEGRGRARWTCTPRATCARRTCATSRALLPAGGRGEGPELRARGRAAALPATIDTDEQRAAADPEEPALERVQVHREAAA